MHMYKILGTILVCSLIGIAVSARTECRKSTMGFDYMGRLSETAKGLPCQPWSSQLPHAHNFTSPKQFPDPTVEGASNYCRSPDGAHNWLGPWCFTMDPDVRYQFCDVPMCADFPECRMTEDGQEYLGYISVTSSGHACSAWPTGEGERNYCRNPDGRTSGPYCYVGSGNSTETCSVPFCKPQMFCKQTAGGVEYSGQLSVTTHGHWCQAWDVQYPHVHNYTDPALFPDALLEEAANYCRNPGGQSSEGPWCYTTDPNVLRDTCDINVCRDCKLSPTGREYSGTLSVTAQGLPCTRWDAHGTPFTDPSRYPDMDVATAGNFCRNPDNSPDGPWCFTSDTRERGSCDVPMCSDDSTKDFRPPMAKHVLHIGVDGLRPDCIEKAPGGAPNLLSRLVSQGTHTITRARTSLITSSAAGWSSSLCGLDAETSGVTGNGWLPPWRGTNQSITPVTGNEAGFPCIFQQLKSQDPSIRTASFYNWGWLGHLFNYGFPGAVDNEVRMLGLSLITDEMLRYKVQDYLKDILHSSDKSYTFLYISYVDSFGHSFSWCNTLYSWAVGNVDRQIGKLLDIIEESGMADDVMVIVNSDHGGVEFNHGQYADSDILVPMFLKGPGIKKNHKFQRDVFNVDIAPTVTHALGVKPSPYWVGKPMDDAFEKK